MNDWLQEWKNESSLKQRMGELFIWHREGPIGPRFYQTLSQQSF